MGELPLRNSLISSYLSHMLSKIATQLPQGSLDVKEFSESSKLPIPEALVQQVQRISCMPSAKREYLHLGSS